ncbi:MAG: phenylacetate--CoA ligase family protein [Planctomycetes bacterium]|nr:phenylacetate--CoA ligase family protein [Planctomycetota bacterium]MBL7037652.1 phenylacetate--CoA ligase family protein [Pirellulaceae bacterium]
MRLLDCLSKHALFPLNERREGTRILPSLHSLEATQWMPHQQFEDLRFRKLRAILEHAFENTAFYRRRFGEAGITPKDIRDFDDLRLLAPLTKDDLVRHQNELIARNLRPSERHSSTTGGSSGTHTPFYRDNACLNVKMAVEYRCNQWCGWDVGRKVAVLWPAVQDLFDDESWKQKLRYRLVNRRLLLYTGELNEAVMSQLAKRLDRFGPRLIRAFPYALAVLAKYIRDATPYRIRPAGILATGEPLLANHRALFEEVFDCPVFNCYSSRECGHIACECESHDGLHINAECLHVEFQMSNKPVKAGEPGHLLLTDLENYGMPFIRYEIGDMGVPLAGQCGCGRTLPRMGMNAGRDTDFLYSPHNDSLISGTICHDFIADGPDVGQLQIIQDSRDHLTIRIKKGRRDAADDIKKEYLKSVIDQVFHGKMRVTFEAVDTISRAKSGKFRVCINQWLKTSDSQTPTWEPDTGPVLEGTMPENNAVPGRA